MYTQKYHAEPPHGLHPGHRPNPARWRKPCSGDDRPPRPKPSPEVTNRLLFELIERARRSDEVRDYYDIAVLGYSGDGDRIA